MAAKSRIDTALVARGLAESREKAQAAIMAGEVYLNQVRVRKASETVSEEDELSLHASSPRYVSRGALKLEKARQVFHADFRDRVVLDVGASTGGFTDVCIQCGARRVYAVDVGYGQLDWKLRNHPKVTVMERTNARYLLPEMFEEKPEMAVMDVSFISIRLILPALAGILGGSGVIYSLIKPQFEAGREHVGKKGVVRDPAVHLDVLRQIYDFIPSIGWKMTGVDFSPITGPEGNIEFLTELKPSSAESPPVGGEALEETVAEAHRQLGR